MLVKCKYCRERIRQNIQALHEKRCIYARRAKKHQSEPEFKIEIVNPSDILIGAQINEIQLIDKGKKKGKKKKNEKADI